MRDRLTERDEYGNADIIGVDSADIQLNLDYDGFNKVTDALNRLAAYEDTGMYPSEVQFVQEEYVRFRKLEDEGRLIVLPSDPCEMADVAQEILSRACRLQREAEAALGGDHDAKS